MALVRDTGWWSYAELARRSSVLASRLQARGVVAESRVGVFLERDVDLVVGLLGVLRSGGAYVPLDPAYPAERLTYVVEDGGVELVLTQTSLCERLPADGQGSLLVDDACLPGEAPALVPQSHPDNLAYVIYTSGSTGRPKGVSISHRSAAALVAWSRELYSAGDLLGVVAATSISFDLSVFELFVPLLRGGRVILVDDALSLLEPLAARPVLLNTVPSAATELCRLGGLPSSLRTVNLAGEPLRRDLVEEIHAGSRVERVWNLYGPSEDTTYSTWWAARHGAAREPAIGRPVSWTRGYVLDRGSRLVGLGVVGELCLGGRGLARGYLGRPSLTARCFVPDACSGVAGERLYRTGDLVRQRQGGELEYLGRGDRQVKVRGFRIELEEIEVVLGTHPGVSAAAVVVVGEQPSLRRLAAFVVRSPGSGVAWSELREYLASRLAPYMVPSSLEELEALPLTPNGKVDRRRLAERSPFAPAGSGSQPERPLKAVEEGLLEIWSEVLNRAPADLGAHSSFFELGGHSLLATRVVARVRAVFGVELALREVFEAPTLVELAQRVELALSGGAARLPALKPAARDGGELPLSFGQERLWFLAQLEPESPAYNMSFTARFEAGLNVAVLSHALSELLRRHEVLRTELAVRDGRPVQKVLAAPEVCVPMIDLGRLPSAARPKLVGWLRSAESLCPFDLSRGPLLRVRVLRLGEAGDLLLATMHHIVSDGWSMDVFARELGMLYGAAARGERALLPELTVQYADYAVWQRRWFSGQELERQLTYWREQLMDVPPVIQLPTDRPRPAQPAYRGATVSWYWPEELAAGLRQTSREAGATLFMTLLAGFQALLSYYSGQTRVAVGTPISGRRFLEIENLIGFFVNTLVLRGDLSGDLTFSKHLEQARETVLEAHEYQDLPFEKLVDELTPERSLSHTPLFQVMFSLDATQRRSQATTGSGAPDTDQRRVAKFELSLSLSTLAEGIGGIAEYSVDIFDATTVRSFVKHLGNFLAGAVANPRERLVALPWLGSPERHQLLLEWSEGLPGTDSSTARWPPVPGLGSPIANRRIYLLDRRLHPVSARIAGGLAIASAGLARRYPRRGALSARQFIPDPFACEPGGRLYRTGDLARYRSDGEIEFLGRVDHQRTPKGKADRRRLSRRPLPRRRPQDTGAAPRDTVELGMIQLFQELLGRDDVGSADSFFDLGGHSLMAVRLMARIEERFDRRIPLSKLFQAPSAGQLARLVRQGATPDFDTLVPIRHGTEARPWFWVHPVGGNVLCYFPLAQRLRPGFPIYGLQSPNLDPHAATLDRIEEMAEHYLRELRAVDPDGPYRLGGWSMGGVVAFEIARRLESEGREVEILALVDTHLAHGELQDDELTLLWRFGRDLGLAPKVPEDVLEALREMYPRERLAAVLRQAHEAEVLAPEIDLTRFEHLFAVFKLHTRAMYDYSPDSYSGRIVLIRPETEAAQAPSSDEVAARWRQLAGSGLELHYVGGDHFMMVREPHVEALAEILNRLLDQNGQVQPS